MHEACATSYQLSVFANLILEQGYPSELTTINKVT